MGILSTIRTSVSSPHQIPIFRQKESVNDFLSLDATSESLMPSYVVNSIPEDTLTVTNPLMVLLQAQSNKRYYEWNFNAASDVVWHVSSKETLETYVVVERLILVGAELIIEGNDFGMYRVGLVDEFDSIGTSVVQTEGQTLSVNDGALSLACTSRDWVKVLEKLCLLSIFEHYSIYKSLSGAIISSYGLKMSDMHVILDSSFNFKDWCEIYLEGEGWVKVWCHIDKVSKNSTSNDNRSGHCQIKFYKNEKSKSSRNLLCFIPDCAYVQDIFFYKDCQKENSYATKSSALDFLKSINTLKVIGDVSFPSEGYSRKHRSSSISNMSFFSKGENRTRSSSSSSINSSTSPNQSPVRSSARSPQLRMFSPSKRHQRTSSQISVDSVYSTHKDLDNCTISSKGLLIRPISHNGVIHLQTMIRFAIPMMDCVRKYGRPKRFKTDRTDPDSLMFGQPKLPSIDYFAAEELQVLLHPETNIECTTPSESSAVALNWLSDSLAKRMLENHTRSDNLTYRTLADVRRQNSERCSLDQMKSESVTTNSSPIV
ncbi:hypothetical protein HG535_0G03320 [Zygotorulaspora mrakii]|uniref:Ig-like domain-containing protein n=1 Tax=Zygotorulaspora mrakii TaxID=42260 RepID=A0A7H9B8X6_ZYGMR|nr:uncharacterized protein HG535_0G03320 [Zygotorulaspora mrakii]QLG74449.1 hypothetical protein HG535_0G03320 [Zygotorulaspora mrakii]